MIRMFSAGFAGFAGVVCVGCVPRGARNPQFTAEAAPPPVMHLAPAVCLSGGTPIAGPAEKNAQLVEARLRADLPMTAIPLAPDARAFVCERLASDKAFFRWDAIGRDWALRPVPRVFIHELATRNGARTVLLPIVRSPPCWFRDAVRGRVCSENHDSIYVGLFLVSAEGIALYEAEAEIGPSASVGKIDSVIDELVEGVPATYAPARADVPPFSLVILPPGTMLQDRPEVERLEQKEKAP